MPAFINLTDQMFQCFKVLERDYEYLTRLKMNMLKIRKQIQ